MTERVQKNSSYLNGKSTTGTQTRVKDTSPTSGMCPICIRDCPFICEISLSAFRGREALYPEPVQFGYSTAGALKDFGLDWSNFNTFSSGKRRQNSSGRCWIGRQSNKSTSFKIQKCCIRTYFKV